MPDRGLGNDQRVGIPAEALFGFAEEFLSQGKPFKFAVTGNSMYPFLRHLTDSVELVRVPYNEILLRDIVMARRLDGVYVMHRVCRISADRFYIVGDSQDEIEGPLLPSQIVAKVAAIYRPKKRIDCRGRLYRLLVWAWMGLLPVRIRILNASLFLRGYKFRF